MTPLRAAGAIALLVISISSAGADDTGVRERMLDLLPELGARTWEKREAAETEILALAQSNRTAVLQVGFEALFHQPDPEVRYRVERILKAIPPEHILEGKRGFLGVSLAPGRAPLMLENGSVMPVDIMNVLPDTAAQASGLQAGDRILKVNDRVCSDRFSVPEVVAHISARAPGSKIRLVLWSGGKVVEKQVTLRVRPDMPNDKPVPRQKETMIEEWFKQNVRRTKKALRSQTDKADQGGSKPSPQPEPAK